jgi:hypothetical protein
MNKSDVTSTSKRKITIAKAKHRPNKLTVRQTDVTSADHPDRKLRPAPEPKLEKKARQHFLRNVYQMKSCQVVVLSSEKHHRQGKELGRGGGKRGEDAHAQSAVYVDGNLQRKGAHGTLYLHHDLMSFIKGGI